MLKKLVALENTVRAATKLIAISIALWCASTQQEGFAQTKPGAGRTATDTRNLQVQAVDVPSANGTANHTQRVALVIGNSAYKSAPLTNPVNDARAIAQALKESGFSVITRENTDQRGMLDALREFGDRLRDGGTGLFYYAGHGMQIKDRNYLIPVGASIEREDEVAYNAVDAQAVLDKMEAAGNVANIMILDACRNNPFTRSTRSGKAGLAQMDAPVGTLVAYATSPGSVASDGSGVNGLYTQHLLSAIRQPGSKVEDVFKQVRANVRRDSQGKQVPWESTSLEGDFYFKGGPIVAGSFDSGQVVEATLWDAVKDSRVPVEIRAYLNRYPHGKFAGEARTRLLQLQPATAAPAQVMLTGSTTPHLVYAVGDSWTFISDNLLTHKPSSYTQQVTSLAANGDAMLSDGAIYTATGQVRYLRNAERERNYSSGYRMVPTQLRQGFKEPVSYEIVSKYKDGHEAKFVAKGTIDVIGREKVTTPAGEFMAWRIRRQMQGVLSNGHEIALDHTFWFVPEIKRVVAHDVTDTNTSLGKTTVHERLALQSFSLTDAKATAAVQVNMAQAATQSGGESFAREAAVDSGSSTAPVKSPRPVIASNQAGFTVGDRWRFQVVDKFKGEVVRNYSTRIDGVTPDGDLVLNKGVLRWDAHGNLRYSRSSSRESMYSPGYLSIPPLLSPGARTELTFAIDKKFTDGRQEKEQNKATMVVKNQEKIKTPAGEFMAWRVEIDDFWQIENSASRGKWSFTGWYVPELRSYVAFDDESRNANGSINRIDRHELTSFSVRGAENLAQR